MHQEETMWKDVAAGSSLWREYSQGTDTNT